MSAIKAAYIKTSMTDYATWTYYTVSFFGVELTLQVKSKHQNDMSSVIINNANFESIDKWDRKALPRLFGVDEVEKFLKENQNRILNRLSVLSIT